MVSGRQQTADDGGVLPVPGAVDLCYEGGYRRQIKQTTLEISVCVSTSP